MTCVSLACTLCVVINKGNINNTFLWWNSAYHIQKTASVLGQKKIYYYWKKWWIIVRVCVAMICHGKWHGQKKNKQIYYFYYMGSLKFLRKFYCIFNATRNCSVALLNDIDFIFSPAHSRATVCDIFSNNVRYTFTEFVSISCASNLNIFFF